MKKVLFVGMAVLLAACSGNNSFTTEDGIEVKYVKKGDGESPVDSLVSTYFMSYSTEDGKELMKVDVNNPLPLKVSEANKPRLGEMYPIFTQLQVGDSVHFEFVASELFEKTFKAPLPDSIPPQSKIKFQLVYLDQMPELEFREMMQENMLKMAEKQNSIDAKILDDYLAENNIDSEVTENGLRYVITKEGSGPKPEQGQMISVAYAGRLLDGTYFDTSMEEVAKEQELYNPNRTYEPYTFPLGGRVIAGWNEGLALLNEGTKATFYIPSSLGYGARGSAPIIKPNDILVFDVELVKVGE